MKNFKSVALFAVFVFSIMVGCVSMPTQEELAKLDYGLPLTANDNYEEQIKSYFSSKLFDPYSAHYSIGYPQQFWYKQSPLMGGNLYAGYMVFVGVNAKNRFGAYVGMQTYGFLFKYGKIIKVLEPAEVNLIRNVNSL